jgi:membrane-associated phospholipid phosphatase
MRHLPRITVILASIAAWSAGAPAQECFPLSENVGWIDSVVSVSSTSFSTPDEPPEDQASLSWHSAVTNLPGDWIRGIGLTARPENLHRLAGIAAVTVGFLASDRETYQFSGRMYDSSKPFHDATDFFVSLGDGQSQFILAGGLATYGLLSSDERFVRAASQTVEAVLATGVVVQVLKRISGRESPEAATQPRGKWTVLPNLREYHKRQSSYYAFPSGHIATSMAAVTVLAENFSDEKWIRPVGYALVGCIGVSLVNRGYHWYSDLPLGVAIGYTFGMIAAHPGGNNLVQASGPLVLISPMFTESGAKGVQFALAF